MIKSSVLKVTLRSIKLMLSLNMQVIFPVLTDIPELNWHC